MTTLRSRVLYAVATFSLLALPASSAPQPVADAQAQGVYVTYTGFRLLPDGRSLIHVELSAPVEVRVSRHGTEVVYGLEGAQVPLKNNKHPLITSAFASNVVAVKLVQRGAPPTSKTKKPRNGSAGSTLRVDLSIVLRAEVTPTHTFTKAASGAVLEVTVPAAKGR